MQRDQDVGGGPVRQEQGVLPAFPVGGEIGRDSLRMLLSAALCAGLAAAAICFILLSQEARKELRYLAAYNAGFLDERLRRALDRAGLAQGKDWTPGARGESRPQGAHAVGEAVEIEVVVHEPGPEGEQERRHSVTLPRANLSRALWRDVPHLGRLDYWLLAAEPAGILDLSGDGDPRIAAADAAALLPACRLNPESGLVHVRGRLAACVFVPTAAAYFLVSADPLSLYHVPLRRSLTLFLITGLMFLGGVLVAHRGQRRYVNRLFNAAGMLRQDVHRRRESIRQLLREVMGHAEARRISEFGHWATRIRDGNFCWHEVDEEVARIYGVDRRQLLGSLADSPHNLHPDDRARIAAHWMYINGKLFPYMLRYRLVQPGGVVREIIEIGEPRFGINGEVLGFHGIVQDVTGRSLDTMQGIIRPPLRAGMPPQS